MQVNRLAHDYVSVQSKPSEPIQAVENQVIARTNNITVKNMLYQDTSQDLSFTFCLSHNLSTTEYSKEISHELSSASFAPDCNSDDHIKLFILVNICAAFKPIYIPSSTACPEPIDIPSSTACPEPIDIPSSTARPEPIHIPSSTARPEPIHIPSSTARPESTIQELQDQVNKQEVQIEALQRDKKLLNAIAATKKFYTIKSAHDKYRLKLWRSEKSKAKAILGSRLRADQIASIGRQSKRGIKWSSETIKDALVFKMKWGTTGFSDFVNYLPIFPSVRTMQRVIEHIKFGSGILDEVFNMLKCATESMSENERDCVIVVDEMVIKAGLVFDASTKGMIGKCTFPTHVGPAKKVLVVMCAGITRRWKVVVAYFFTEKEDPKIKNKKANYNGIAMKDIILGVIDKCEKIGLKVHSITTDMRSENRAMWNAFGIGCTRQSDAIISIQHSIRPEDRFYFLPDAIHLFKNIITMLESNKIIHLPHNFLVFENLTHPVVDIQHIDDVLQFELQFEMKIAYRLKKAKLHCQNSYEKMKVGTARSVFNRRTEIALKRYAEVTGNDAYRTTAAFIRLVSHWFDLMSNRFTKLALGLLNNKAYEEAIDHIKRTAYVFRFMTVGNDKHWKPCQTGVIMSCTSIINLQNYFLFKRCYKFLLIGRFTQCCLENLFSVLRVRQPIPNPLQVKQNLRVLVLTQVCTNAKNTSYDNDTYDENIENIRIDFIKFSTDLAIAQRTESVEELMESLPQLKDHHMNLIDSWELYIIYDIAVSVLHSIKIGNMTVCNTCFNSVLWQKKDRHPYSLVTEIRNYRDNNLIEVSDDCFKAIIKSEITFREIRDDICEATKINIINFLVDQMEYVWNGCHIPTCRSITQKILKKFFTMRLRTYSIKRCEDLAHLNNRHYNSKTMAMNAIVRR